MSSAYIEDNNHEVNVTEQKIMRKICNLGLEKFLIHSCHNHIWGHKEPIKGLKKLKKLLWGFCSKDDVVFLCKIAKVT